MQDLARPKLAGLLPVHGGGPAFEQSGNGQSKQPQRARPQQLATRPSLGMKRILKIMSHCLGRTVFAEHRQV